VKILMTGHDGYIGTVMAPFLREAGHEVSGLDAFLYEGCVFGDGSDEAEIPARRLDVRDVRPEHLEGFDAVVHLAALSNDPLGDLNADATYAVNHRASVRIAGMARDAGVERFLFASSCSLYGVAGDDVLDETADFNPITPYGESKVMVEEDLSGMAGDGFSPTYMRNATVYGVSPRLRADIVVNNLVGLAHTTGEILMKSDGTPWRPLVHVEDVCRAFRAALEAPRETVHDVAFNVGRTAENYRIREVAEIVAEAMPETEVAFAEGAGPDPRNYRVDCSRLEETLPSWDPQWTVPDGVRELRDAFRAHDLDAEDFRNRYVRLRRIGELQDEGLLDEDLRWTEEAGTRGVASAAAG
jgi:nucleoside-diphosphate-sugar epimerase